MQAQTGDWQAVMNIPPGSRITVNATHRVRCVFLRAAGDELVCEYTHRDLFPIDPPEIKLDRPSVREIRL